ncbi:MAG: 50S ribosomal protein L29 [Nitrospiria bacterium]
MKPETSIEATLEELSEKEQALRKELFNLRFQAATGHIENTNRFREVRREIARVLTFLKIKKEKEQT